MARPSLFINQVTAEDIKKALEDKHRNRVRADLFFTEVKNGSTWLKRKGELYIIDALAIRPSWTNPRFIGYEVKVSRSDFLQDNKWHNYLEYCNEFSFVCPEGLIEKNELPKEVGLMYYSALKKNIRTARVAKKYEKPPDWSILFYLLITRNEGKREKSEVQKDIEFYLKHRRTGRFLASEVRAKIIKDLIKTEETRRKWQYRAMQLEEENKKLIAQLALYEK